MFISAGVLAVLFNPIEANPTANNPHESLGNFILLKRISVINVLSHTKRNSSDSP